MVPGTLVNTEPTKCIVTRTYWMLTGYQNAKSFNPSYSPGTPSVTPVSTCNTTQTWAWTITNTPCQPCMSADATAANTDVCNFQSYANYWQSTVSGTTSSSYKRPMFYVGPGGTNSAATQGTQIYQQCIYSGTGSVPRTGYTGTLEAGRMSGSVNATALAANCGVSGRGNEVLINPLGGTTCTAGPGGLAVLCPMQLIQFVPQFPGKYSLEFSVADGCNAPQTSTVTITAKCSTAPKITPLNPVPEITTYYYCESSNAAYKWGDKTRDNVPVGQTVPGLFQPLSLIHI